MSGRYKNTLFCLNKSTRQLPVASLALSGHCAPWCFHLCSCGTVKGEKKKEERKRRAMQRRPIGGTLRVISMTRKASGHIHTGRPIITDNANFKTKFLKKGCFSVSFQQIALWCKMEPWSLICFFPLCSHLSFCVYFLNFRRTGQCENHGGIILSGKSKLIMQFRKGSTVSRVTCEGETSRCKMNQKEAQFCMLEILQMALPPKWSVLHVQEPSASTVGVASCWQL